MNRFGATALTAGSLCIGCEILGTAFTEEIMASAGSFIFMLVMGSICLFAGVIFFKMLCLPAWKNKNRTLKDEVNEMINPDQTGKADADEEDALITDFRQSVYEFFATIGIKPNDLIQHTATQLYWHMLHLQKTRMDAKNVALQFEAERKSYGGVSVTKNHYFDGKYEITEAQERIAAKRTYTCGNYTFSKTDNEIASYSILNAHKNKKDLILCPNCGGKSTRENLLDGCDYCGTMFTIEDLGKRISSFALRNDFEVAYAKYTDRRAFYNIRSFLVGAVPAFIFSIIEMFKVAIKEQEGIITSIAIMLIGAAMIAGFTGLFTRIFFFVCIFPFIQLKESAKYAVLKKMKENDSQNAEIVKEIKQKDPLFSQEFFFSSIQNKLATIHYADKGEQISVFAEGDLSAYLKEYADVVDMDVTNIEIGETAFDESESRIEVYAKLNLIRFTTSGFTETKETVHLLLVKDAACKTAAVCEPSVLRCKGCGSSILLLDGGKCQFCGTKLNLKQYDWVIRDYRIV